MFCTNHEGANSQWLNHGTVTTTTIWDLSEDEMFVWNPSFLDISFEHLLPVAIAPSNLALCLHQKVTRIFGWACSVSSLDQMVSTTWPGLLQHATFRHVMFVCTSCTRPRDACKFMPRSAGTCWRGTTSSLRPCRWQDGAKCKVTRLAEPGILARAPWASRPYLDV